MIRVAKLGDIPRIIQLGKELHAESCYSDQLFDADVAESKIASLINGEGVVFVSLKDGMIVGGMAGGVTTQWFSSEKIAFDYSLFISKSHRHGITALKLLKAFEIWARNIGASQIVMGITTDINIDATTRLYKSVGFESAGKMFRKAL